MIRRHSEGGRFMRSRRGAAVILSAAAMTTGSVTAGGLLLASRAHATDTIQNIQHVIVIMQENRSFDEYFGKYPGANGLAAPACNPDPYTGACVHPYHDTNNADQGGGHGPDSVPADMDVQNGVAKMDGYVGQYYKHWGMTSCNNLNPLSPDPTCSDSMGYKDRSDIPNYWAYADNYALQDNLYESVPSWSRTAHVAMVSGWSASCPKDSKTGQVTTDPLLCKSVLATGDHYDDLPEATTDCDDFDPIPSTCSAQVPDYAWTDVTYLLHKNNVSWTYFSASDTPDMWKPLGDFQDVHSDGQAQPPGPSSCCFKSTSDFVNEAQNGTLPQVSWVIPGHLQSDHPSLSPEALISDSESYVTQMVNAAMSGPDWNSTAIFLSWDDWGGYYDHMPPPNISQFGDKNGVGIRVPALVISPYAKIGYIDHQALTFDSYLRFIEDDFVAGCRLTAAKTLCDDRKPDARPDTRENLFGDLQQDFDFSQTPRPPILLGRGQAPGLPVIGIAHTKVNAGSSTQVSGSNFQPNETVNFSLGIKGSDCWAPGCPTSTLLGSTVADSSGSFSNVSLTLPAGDSGSYVIAAVGTSGDPLDAAGINQQIVAQSGSQPPSAALSVSPKSGQAPIQVTADASGSTATQNPIAGYSFDFGDGTVLGQSADAVVQHTYTSGGNFTVTVTVTDTQAQSSTASQQVSIGYPNLVGNPGFESSTTGWKAGPNTLLGFSSSAHSGNQAAQLTPKKQGRVTLNDYPGWNTNTEAGDTCTVSAWMQGPAGVKLNAQATESGSSGKVAQAVKGVTGAANTWEHLTVKLTIVNSGDSLRLAFFGPLQLGQQLLVDDVSEVCVPPPPDGA